MSKAKVYYVDASAHRQGDGSKDRPFKHIGDAAKIATAGDEVVVLPGIYREWVCPVNAGTKDARITYRSKEPLGAVITGAEEVKNWKKYKGTTWTVSIDNSIFGAYNPYIEKVEGDWYFSDKVRHTGAVFLNDAMMYEADSLDECLKAKADPYSWDQEASKYNSLWSRTGTGQYCTRTSAVRIPTKRMLR